MEVLDVGCGVGGPAREIARFTGCQVVGVNNNGYQIARATRHTQKAGLQEQVSFFKGDFMVSIMEPYSQLSWLFVSLTINLAS